MSELREVTETALHFWLCCLTIGIGAITSILLLFITAPYGRHQRRGYGPLIPAKLSWVMAELPASLLFALIFFMGKHRLETVPLIFLAMWQSHYLQRAFIYPLRMPNSGKGWPLGIIVMAVLFNCVNAYLNARWISEMGEYRSDWLTQPAFLVGVLVFYFGYAGNLWSDNVLFKLKRQSGGGYQIPRGGLYEYLSCPNYFSEMVEWAGWAIATWSLSGLSFFIFTVANLAPRALSNHRWYREKFPDYPAARKAILPFMI